MTMQYKLYSLSISFLLLLVTVATASNGPQITGYQSGSLTVDKTYHYRTTLLDQNFRPAVDRKSHIIDIGYTIYLDYVFKWKLSILMGEPVIIGWVSYKPTQFYSLDSDIEINVLSDKLLKKIKLTEFKMKVHMFVEPPGQRAHDHGASLVIDAGSPSKPYFGYSSTELTKKGDLFSDFASFNTPGSPDWSKLFTNIRTKQQAKKYFTDLTSSARKRDRYYASYYRHDVVKSDVDSSIVDQAIYKYLQGLEKKIRDKEKAKQKKLQEQNKKKVDAFDDALDQTETVSADTDDFLSEVDSRGADSLEELLEESEKITLTLENIPRTTRANVITISGQVENVSSIDSSEIVFRVNGLEQPVCRIQQCCGTRT